LFLKAAFFSLFSAFIGEPLFGWLGFYENVYWEYYYSVPILFLIYLAAHSLSNRTSFNQI